MSEDTNKRVEIENQGDGWWGKVSLLSGRVASPPAPCFGDELLRYYIVELDEPLTDAGRGSGVSRRMLVMEDSYEATDGKHYSVPAFPIDSSTPAEQKRFTFADTWSGAKVSVRFVDS